MLSVSGLLFSRKVYAKRDLSRYFIEKSSGYAARHESKSKREARRKVKQNKEQNATETVSEIVVKKQNQSSYIPTLSDIKNIIDKKIKW